ncbi:glycosyltransferase family 4 protein [Pseudoalteromonas sp. YIC-827]|uniref:Glycosyltransferase family 4 protein n=1 Tax=Pseudoalteromonas qingdaonensis TaxID=3131913 RepID=A0ABU9MSD7_9GAMM
MKIIVIGTYPPSLINFRGALLARLAQKHDVIALANGASQVIQDELNALGVKYIDYPVSRSGFNPFKDIITLHTYRKLFAVENPDLVLSYTIKPIVWGGIAARLCGVKGFIAMVTGLGYAFQKGGLLKKGLVSLVTNLYKVALKSANAVIFQNPDNLKVFVDESIVPKKKCFLVNGSGVNLEKFTPAPLPVSNSFLLIARLLGDKGIREYYHAAKLVRQLYPQAIFNLVGPTDPSPDGIQFAEVEKWVSEGVIQYHGSTDDVRPFIESSRFFVLPSYHEGLPRTVLEAMAMSRPILTTNVPGCRETVINGENGWMVDKEDAEQLAEKMIWMIEHPKKVDEMAKASLALVREKFDVHKVNEEILKIMEIS